MAVHDLKDQIARLPEQPGVYLWGDARGETIYVGKARSLRDRVRNYLAGFNNLKTETFVEAGCTVVFCVIDQA